MERPVQIVHLSDLESGSQLIFDQEAFQSCLEGIPPEAHVVVMTVNGALRTGKSFLMNAIVHRLKHGEITNQTKISENFHWKHGIEADTMGMWLWGKPFQVTLKNGNQAYLLLIDTQGIFDSNLNPKLTNCLFGLSTLISSMQIYNIEKRIQEDHLQHLELFAEYAKAVTDVIQKSNLSNLTPFQNLRILIRDWPNNGNSGDPVQYENEAGEYLESIMEGKNAHAITTRENIHRCYRRIECSFLPHPGLSLAEGDFSDDFESVRPEFITNLNHLIEGLLTNLEAKSIFSELMQIREVGDYMSRYLDMLYSCTELPEPSTILDTTINALEQGVHHRAVSMYQTKMRKRLDNDQSFSNQQLKDLHQAVQKDVREYAETRLVMGEPERKKIFMDQLSLEIDQEYRRFVELNSRKLRWMTYVWVAGCGLIALIISKLTIIICTAELCLKLSNFSYSIFLISVAIILIRFMYLLGLFHRLWEMINQKLNLKTIMATTTETATTTEATTTTETAATIEVITKASTLSSDPLLTKKNL